MDRYRVLYVVGRRAVTSVPVEVARHLDLGQFEVTIVTCFPAGTGSEDAAGSITVIELGARGKYDVRAWCALYYLIQQHRPHILHLHHTLPAVLGCLCGRLLNVPAIVNSRHHDQAELGLGRSFLELITLALSDLIVCNSNYTCSSFRLWERRLAGHKCLIVYNGVDIQRIDRSFVEPARIRAQLGIRADDFVIGHVGRQVREKDQETLIRALAILLDNGLAATLVVVGAGPLQARLLSLASSLGLQERVVFTGEVARQRVYEILPALDLFVMSSTTEGFGNAVVEAMAARRPVVVTNAGALPEVVGEAGRLAPPRSPAALAAAILELAQLSPVARAALGKAGRNRVETCYTIQRTGAEYSRSYRQILHQKGIVAA